MKTAIPLIMGANIGTTTDMAIVSFTQVAKREDFKRGMAAGTLHSMFNWLTVVILLPIEVIARMSSLRRIAIPII